MICERTVDVGQLFVVSWTSSQDRILQRTVEHFVRCFRAAESALFRLKTSSEFQRFHSLKRSVRRSRTRTLSTFSTLFNLPKPRIIKMAGTKKKFLSNVRWSVLSWWRILTISRSWWKRLVLISERKPRGCTQSFCAVCEKSHVKDMKLSILYQTVVSWFHRKFGQTMMLHFERSMSWY